MAASTLLSLLPQIGEQVDYLRFLPERKTRQQPRLVARAAADGSRGGCCWAASSSSPDPFSPGLALRHGLSLEEATQPTSMYSLAFRQTLGSPSLGLILAGVFVIVCQLKINVTNAYAAPLPGRTSFPRLTHSHPGRVVWLVFNVVLALLLMETNICTWWRAFCASTPTSPQAGSGR